MGEVACLRGATPRISPITPLATSSQCSHRISRKSTGTLCGPAPAVLGRCAAQVSGSRPEG